MYKKIVCILVMTLLITTALPAIGMTSQKNKKTYEDTVLYETSCGQAPYTPNFVEKTAKQLDIRGTPFYICDLWGAINLYGPCYFMPANPSIIYPLGPTSSMDWISGGTWINGVWYGCDSGFLTSTPNIWTINPHTVLMNLVGSYDPGGTGLRFTGLAYDQTTNTLYGCSITDLYTVSMSTGASTLVGSFGISNSLMIGIAFDSSGNLYGTELDTDSLYSINPSTGATTLVGPLGFDILYAQDMAFDWDTGILYLAAFNNDEYAGILYTCNPATGATTKIGNFLNDTQYDGLAIPYYNGETTVILNPFADATVVEGYPYDNFGTIGSLYLQSSNVDYKNERIYLEFDLSSIPDSAIITHVDFRLYCWQALVADVGADLYGIEGSWGETTITWDNQPFNPGSDPLLSNRMMSTINDYENWCVWAETPDVIEYVQICIPLDDLSFMIKCNPESVGGSYGFDSREWAVNTGELIITYLDPPLPIGISGPTTGKVGESYSYSFTLIDPDGDDIAEYTINWGDGPDETITGLFPSGSLQTKSHTWTSQGKYTIKAKAKDVYGAEGDWGTLDVSIPRARTINKMTFFKLFECFPNAFLISRLLLEFL